MEDVVAFQQDSSPDTSEGKTDANSDALQYANGGTRVNVFRYTFRPIKYLLFALIFTDKFDWSTKTTNFNSVDYATTKSIDFNSVD